MRITGTITRVEPYRDGCGTLVGLNCYVEGFCGSEVLLGCARAQDSLGDGTVRFGDDLYELPFGVSERLRRIGEDLIAYGNRHS